MKPREMIEVIDGFRYNTSTATLIAGNNYWSHCSFERSGRNAYLYRTLNGKYFATYVTHWQGELDRLEPLTQGAAIKMFENLPKKLVEFSEAFPGVTVEEA